MMGCVPIMSILSFALRLDGTFISVARVDK